jgi:hypothetical protein
VSSNLPQHILLIGAERTLAPDFHLQAGPLRMLYREGVFRYVALDRQEIVRAVYLAVRDRHWRTIPGVISNLDVRSTADSFQVTYDCAHREQDIDFRWKVHVTGDRDGTIVWKVQGEAFSSFEKNRIGICVLHPLDGSIGKPCQIKHTDGSIEESRFPREVAPHQPFLDVAALRFRVSSELEAELAFTGDVFETEDQRNWTDASFKTYSTPLSIPFPVAIEKGTMVSQAVTLKLYGSAAAATEQFRFDEEVTITIRPEERTRLPRIGLKWAGSRRSLSFGNVARLQALCLDHLCVNLNPGEAGSEEEFWKAAELADGLSVPLEVALAGELETASLVRVLDAILQRKVHICSWLADVRLESADRTAQRRALEAVAPVVLGRSGHFADLNRNRPSAPDRAGVWFSMSPQVHATDDTTMMENLAAQPHVLASIRSWAGPVPVTVSPVTLKTRFTHLPEGESGEDGNEALPEDVDPRQSSLLAAGWTLGSLKHLAEGGVASITYYETAGWRGVMETEAGSPLPSRFHSIAGAVFPTYHVFADVAGWKPAEVLRTESTDPLKVECLALMQPSGLRLVVANLSGGQVSVQLRLDDLATRTDLRVMDEDTVEGFMMHPESRRRQEQRELIAQDGTVRFALKPYAIATVDALLDPSRTMAEIDQPGGRP